VRIAIVNDILIAIEALRRVFVTVADYQLAWVARNGAEAVAKCAKDTPDLILMDLFMPVMDGVEATRQIMSNSPCAIVIVTATVREHAGKVFEAMGYGALDAVNTPILGSGGNPHSGTELLAKIATISKLLGKPSKSTNSKSTEISQVKQSYLSQRTPPLVAIGASTGGPKALGTILCQLPANFKAAVVIIQHVDVEFAPSLAKWLNGQTRLTVELAIAPCKPEVGKVLLAGSNDHLILRSNGTLDYTPEPLDFPYRPSIDVFFKSVAEHWQRKGIGILLTGMGKDGAVGLSLLRAAGWHTIAQNRETSVVYGMPKAAVEMGAAVEILPIEAIASASTHSLALPL